MAFDIINKEKLNIPKGILFDMDGVVLDSEKLYTRFWAEACKEKGFNMTWKQALGMRSTNKIKGQAYLEKCFGKGIDYSEIREIRIRRMDEFIKENGVEVKDGAVELLDFLNSKKIPCAITSSSPLDRIKDHLSQNNILEKFNKICSAHQVKNGKPEPDIYIFGAESLGLEPKDCLALEDSPSGIESAFRAGCMVAVIPDQDQPSKESLEKAVIKADNLKDIIELINSL